MDDGWVMGGWWVDDGWMMGGWWVDDGWVMGGWWVDDGWMMGGWWMDDGRMMGGWWTDDGWMDDGWVMDGWLSNNWCICTRFIIYAWDEEMYLKVVCKKCFWNTIKARITKFKLRDMRPAPPCISLRILSPHCYICTNFIIYAHAEVMYCEKWFGNTIKPRITKRKWRAVTKQMREIFWRIT